MRVDAPGRPPRLPNRAALSRETASNATSNGYPERWAVRTLSTGAPPGAVMIRPILKYGDDTLHEPARPVDAVTPDVDRLVGDMIETMYVAPGIGLAAPQIGLPLRIFVIDLSLGRDPEGLIVMINPEFVDRGGMQLEEEGCLSLPGFNATVVRPSRAVVKGFDRTGVEHTREGTGLLARAFQHEMDHLDGTLFVDRLRGIKRDLIVRKIRKLARAGKW
jgi:peptide deformylase